MVEVGTALAEFTVYVLKSFAQVQAWPNSHCTGLTGLLSDGQ